MLKQKERNIEARKQRTGYTLVNEKGETYLTQPKVPLGHDDNITISYLSESIVA